MHASHDDHQPVPIPPWVRWWVVACVACVFGPYVVSGIRTEQLAMYGSAAAIVITQAPRLWGFLAPAAPFIALWAGYAGIVAVGAVFTENSTSWASGSLVAGLDNAALPLATIVTVAFWRTFARGHELMRVAAQTLVAAMSVNSVVAIWTTFAGIDAPPGLSRFWAADGTDVTVASLSEQMGRFSGVFNQPAEAGIAYSLAAFSLLYLVRTGSGARWKHLFAWVLIIVGGLLTLSKVFVVGGIAVAFLMLLTDRRNRVRMTLTGGATVGAMGGAAMTGLVGSWGASIMLNWYRVSVQTGDSPLYTLSAGRFGSPGTDGPPSISVPTGPVLEGSSGATGSDVPVPGALSSIAGEVIDHHPVFGLGARGIQVAYDSMWTEALVMAGIVGALLVLAACVLMVVRVVTLRTRLRTPEWVFALAVAVLVLGASFGMPALTGNRESTLLWIFVGFLLLSPATAALRPRAEAGDHPASDSGCGVTADAQGHGTGRR